MLRAGSPEPAAEPGKWNRLYSVQLFLATRPDASSTSGAAKNHAQNMAKDPPCFEYAQSSSSRLTFKDDDEFIEFMREHLRESHGDMVDAFPAEDFHDLATNGMARVRRYGFDDYQDIAAYLALMFEIAPNFDTEPRLAAILAEVDEPAVSRWNRLFAADMSDAWVAAEAAYDEQAWFGD